MKKNKPFVSVIIPVKSWNKYLEEDVKHLLEGSYQNFEALILMDKESIVSYPKTKIIATGRSDFPNQINNALAFPGVFRGAINAKATKITGEMKLAAARALAGSVEPTRERILPDVLDKSIVKLIADAVKKEARKNKVIRR